MGIILHTRTWICFQLFIQTTDLINLCICSSKKRKIEVMEGERKHNGC